MIDLRQGDCIEVMKSIESGSVDMVLTDIPYNISTQTNFKTIKDYTKKQGETEYNCMDFGEWDKQFSMNEPVEEFISKVKNRGSCVVFSAWQQLEQIRKCYVSTIPNSMHREPRIGVWHKSNPSVFNMQRMAIQPYEFFIWLGVGSNVTFNNQNIDNGKVKAERHYFETATQRGLHPTLKPVEVVEHLIKTYTNEGDTVLDPFMGSGTTGVACKNLNRNFIGIELDENYFNIAKERIENA